MTLTEALDYWIEYNAEIRVPLTDWDHPLWSRVGLAEESSLSRLGIALKIMRQSAGLPIEVRDVPTP